MIVYVMWLMNTYNFKQEIVNLEDWIVVILTIQTHVQREQ